MPTGTAPITTVRSIPMILLSPGLAEAFRLGLLVAALLACGFGCACCLVEPLIVQDRAGSIAYLRQCSRYSAS